MSEKESALGISALEEDVLTLLKNGSLYGLGILDRVNQARIPVGINRLGVGSLYPSLGRMEGKKWVSAEWGEEKSGGARRKYYSITEKGLTALTARQQMRIALSKSNEQESPRSA